MLKWYTYVHITVFMVTIVVFSQKRSDEFILRYRRVHNAVVIMRNISSTIFHNEANGTEGD